MGKHTPSLSGPAEKRDYIEHHLSGELRWLLAAATEWNIQNELNLQIAGYEVQVYAMDSTCLHARTLFEFFTQPTRDNYYGVDQFLGHGVILHSVYQKDWKDPLHGFLMHAQDRSRPIPLMSAGVAKDLNKMPVDFAHEILRLWEEFETMLAKSNDRDIQGLQTLARDKRREAIDSAANVVRSKVAQTHAGKNCGGLEPLFSYDPQT